MARTKKIKESAFIQAVREEAKKGKGSGNRTPRTPKQSAQATHNIAEYRHNLTIEDRAKGGKAKALKAQKRKTAQEILSQLLQLDVSLLENAIQGSAIADAVAKADNGLSIYDGIMLAQLASALQGSTASAQFVRDTVGDKPQEAQASEALTAADMALLRKMESRIQPQVVVEVENPGKTTIER